MANSLGSKLFIKLRYICFFVQTVAVHALSHIYSCTRASTKNVSGDKLYVLPIHLLSLIMTQQRLKKKKCQMDSELTVNLSPTSTSGYSVGVKRHEISAQHSGQKGCDHAKRKSEKSSLAWPPTAGQSGSSFCHTSRKQGCTWVQIICHTSLFIFPCVTMSLFIRP